MYQTGNIRYEARQNKVGAKVVGAWRPPAQKKKKLLWACILPCQCGKERVKIKQARLGIRYHLFACTTKQKAASALPCLIEKFFFFFLCSGPDFSGVCYSTAAGHDTHPPLSPCPYVWVLRKHPPMCLVIPLFPHPFIRRPTIWSLWLVLRFGSSKAGISLLWVSVPWVRARIITPCRAQSARKKVVSYSTLVVVVVGRMVEVPLRSACVVFIHHIRQLNVFFPAHRSCRKFRQSGLSFFVHEVVSIRAYQPCTCVDLDLLTSYPLAVRGSHGYLVSKISIPSLPPSSFLRPITPFFWSLCSASQTSSILVPSPAGSVLTRTVVLACT